jgi:hypothetical protein
VAPKSLLEGVIVYGSRERRAAILGNYRSCCHFIECCISSCNQARALATYLVIQFGRTWFIELARWDLVNGLC